MENPTPQIHPKDRNLDKRVMALGVVGFMALTGLFFCLGLYCVGPVLRSHFRPQPEIKPPSAYAPPARLHQETPPPPEPERGTILDLEITERSDTSADERRRSPSDEGVYQDESGLTVRLEPEDGDEPPVGRSGDSSARQEKRVFRVQAGMFANKTNAESLAADLKANGYKAEVQSVQMEDRTAYRVQLGKYKTREDARELANDLSAKGYSPMVTEETPE